MSKQEVEAEAERLHKVGTATVQQMRPKRSEVYFNPYNRKTPDQSFEASGNIYITFGLSKRSIVYVKTEDGLKSFCRVGDLIDDRVEKEKRDEQISERG